MESVGIVGLGLIGGSLAKALKIKCGVRKIIAYNHREQPLKKALREGMIDDGSLSIDERFRQCDMVFICTPVDKIIEYVRILRPYLHKDCIITDVGSTKRQIAEEIQALQISNFIGGHPMAGSEKTGYSASKSTLFENAYYVLAPVGKEAEEKLSRLRSFVVQMGAIPVEVDPVQHDHLVGAVSHVPHVIASALVNTVANLDDLDGRMKQLAAGGFKDITRIASADPLLWSAIVCNNQKEILTVLTEFQKQLGRFMEAAAQDALALTKLFAQAKAYRDGFSDDISKEHMISVEVEDKPGIVASIASLLSENHLNIKNIRINNHREDDYGVLSITLDDARMAQQSVALLESMNYTVCRRN